MPDESTILRFRHLLEKRDLAADMLRAVNGLLEAKQRAEAPRPRFVVGGLVDSVNAPSCRQLP